MALYLYKEANADSRLSIEYKDGYFPFSVSFDGSTGGARIYKLYLRNDNPAYYYTNITVQALDNAVLDHTDNSVGWSWKLIDKEVVPVEGEWSAVSNGNILALNNLGSSTVGDAATYISFWLRIEIPPRQLVQNITSIVLRITAKENLVGY